MNNKTPMKIDYILDDVVLLILDGHKPLSDLGIDKSKVYVKIVGYDEYGLWDYRPSFPVPILFLILSIKLSGSFIEVLLLSSGLLGGGFLLFVPSFDP